MTLQAKGLFSFFSFWSLPGAPRASLARAGVGNQIYGQLALGRPPEPPRAPQSQSGQGWKARLFSFSTLFQFFFCLLKKPWPSRPWDFFLFKPKTLKKKPWPSRPWGFLVFLVFLVSGVSQEHPGPLWPGLGDQIYGQLALGKPPEPPRAPQSRSGQGWKARFFSFFSCFRFEPKPEKLKSPDPPGHEVFYFLFKPKKKLKALTLHGQLALGRPPEPPRAPQSQSGQGWKARLFIYFSIYFLLLVFWFGPKNNKKLTLQAMRFFCFFSFLGGWT